MFEVKNHIFELALAFEKDDFQESVLSITGPYEISFEDAQNIFYIIFKMENDNFPLMQEKMSFFYENILKKRYTNTRGSLKKIFANIIFYSNLPQNKQFQLFDVFQTLTDDSTKGYFIKSMKEALIELNNSFFDTTKTIQLLDLYGKNWYADHRNIFRQCNTVFRHEKDFMNKLKDIFAPYQFQGISFNLSYFSKEENEDFFQSAMDSKEWRQKLLFLKRQKISFACRKLSFSIFFKEYNKISLREIDIEKTLFILKYVGKKQFLFFLEKEPYLTIKEKQLFKGLANGK
jgi:hypothetical protein